MKILKKRVSLASGALAAALVLGLSTTALSQTAATWDSETMHGNGVIRSYTGLVGFDTSLEERCTRLKQLIARANGAAGAQQYEKSDMHLMVTQVLKNGTIVSLVRRTTVVCPGLPDARPFTDPAKLALVQVNDPRSIFNQTQVWVGADTVEPSPASADDRTQPNIQSSCKTPNQEVTVLEDVAPVYPQSARDLGIGAVTVQVEVTVGPSGSLVSASIYKSANNMALDQAALRAARQCTYSPKLQDCKPVYGSYLFTANFQSSQE